MKTQSMMKNTATPMRMRRVVDAPTRLFHWFFALCFVGAYSTAESEMLQVVHAALGYTMVALLTFRLMYGWLGPRSVQWLSLMKQLRSGWSWLQSFENFKDAPWKTMMDGQKFAIVLATSGLMLLCTPLLLSGHVIFVSSSIFWEEIHELTADAMLLLVFVHLGMLLVFSIIRGTNLAWPMWSGHIAGAGPDLVSRPRVGLAVTVALISGVFGFWSAVDATSLFMLASA